MKMKKLLSIGALGLVLACSTSIGASAAEKPTNEKIKSDMISMFLQDKSPLAYNVNASTVVGTVVDKKELIDVVREVESYATNYGIDEDFVNLNKALDLIDETKTIKQNAITIFTKFPGDDLDDLLSEAKVFATTLKDVQNENSDATASIEKDIAKLVTKYNTDLDVKFGKNIDGKITMSVLKGDQIILQLNSGNAYTIKNSLENNIDKLEEYAGLLN